MEENNMKTKRLTENQLRQIIKESIKKVLSEEPIVLSQHTFEPMGTISWGKDSYGYFVCDKRNNSCKRFDNEKDAETYARQLEKHRSFNDYIERNRVDID